MDTNTEQIFIVTSTENQPTSLQPEFVIPEEVLKSEDVQNATHMCQIPQTSITTQTTMCRLCAKVTEFIIPIFEGEGLQNRLADKIHQHLPIQVSPNDVLPTVLCFQCSSTLLAWHELVMCSVQADNVMRERYNLYLSNSKIQEQPNISSKEDNVKIKAEDKVKTENSRAATEVETLEDGSKRRIAADDVGERDDDETGEERESPRPAEIVVGADGKRYARCGTCARTVVAAGWSRHARLHGGARRHACGACPRAFRERGNLLRHQRAVHGGARPHLCAACGRAFSRRAHLAEHAAVHGAGGGAGGAALVCSACGAAAASAGALRVHGATHGAARLQCAACGARFKRGSELRAHGSVHERERRHGCACGRTFRLRAQLNRHARTHPPRAPPDPASLD